MMKNLERFVDRCKSEDAKFLSKCEADREESGIRMTQARKELLPKLAPASKEDYIDWLRGLLEAGYEPTHYYDYPFSRWGNFYIAQANITLVPLRGSAAINIIVPAGIEVSGSRGHCNIFSYDGYKYAGIIPVFSDTLP